MSDQCQPHPKDHQMSNWPEVVPLLATRCFYQGVHLTKGQFHPKIWEKMSTWPEASSTGGMSDQMSPWPKHLRKMSTWPKASPMRGPSDLSVKRTSENLNTLCILGLASQVFSIKDQWMKCIPGGTSDQRVSLTQRFEKNVNMTQSLI